MGDCMLNNEIHVSLTDDKCPYIKIISNDPIINLTGESGSGKSFYAKEYFDSDDYIVIDTDEVYAVFPRLFL